MPAECVEVASSWSLQDEGFWCQSAKEFFSTVPIPIANEEQKANREKRGGRGGKHTH